MSIILAIDTASPEIAIVLAADGQIVDSVTRDATMQHSQVLLAAIDDVLGASRPELAGIAVVRGPGNYAGLRVGLATAQGLALSVGVPVRGISTLEAAMKAAAVGDCLAIHPAGRGEFALQPFQGGVAEGAMRVSTADELRERADRRTVVGEGARAFGGIDVGPAARCRAALLALLPEFESGAGADVDALYLREPNITLPRAKPVPARSR